LVADAHFCVRLALLCNYLTTTLLLLYNYFLELVTVTRFTPGAVQRQEAVTDNAWCTHTLNLTLSLPPSLPPSLVYTLSLSVSFSLSHALSLSLSHTHTHTHSLTHTHTHT
jgi:hypothetical protein